MAMGSIFADTSSNFTSPRGQITPAKNAPNNACKSRQLRDPA